MEKDKVFTLSLPPLPSNHQPRHKEIEDLKKLIKDAGAGAHVLACVRGWPGVGKTTLLAELANNEEILSDFNKRILWISLGQNPDIGYQLLHCAAKLGFKEEALKDLSHNDIMNFINGELIDKKFLIFIDDVWETSRYEYFKFGGKKCVTVVATRRNDVADAIAPNLSYKLDDMKISNSMALMNELAPRVLERYQNECADLINHLGRLPLIIKIVGRLLNDAWVQRDDIPKLIGELKGGGPNLLGSKLPHDVHLEGPTKTVYMLLERSLKQIDVAKRPLYALLSVFGTAPVHYDREAIKAVWNVDDPQPVLGRLLRAYP